MHVKRLLMPVSAVSIHSKQTFSCDCIRAVYGVDELLLQVPTCRAACRRFEAQTSDRLHCLCSRMHVLTRKLPWTGIALLQKFQTASQGMSGRNEPIGRRCEFTCCSGNHGSVGSLVANRGAPEGCVCSDIPFARLVL